MPSNQAENQHLLRVGRPADQRGIFRWLPGLYTLRHYRPQWLLSDLSAGLVLTAVLVPVGMAYAEAGGLPAIYGLYATIVPLLAYALFGPSRILVLGPDSSLAPMIAAAILPLAAGDPQRAVTLAAMLAILAGLFGVAAGLLRLGFITDLLAKPIRYGYMNGIALTVLVSQLPKLFGFSVKADGLIERAAGFVSGVLSGQANWITLALGGSTLLIILLLKRFKRIPGVLIAVGGATLAVGWLNLSARFGVGVLGDLPQGLPNLVHPGHQPGRNRRPVHGCPGDCRGLVCRYQRPFTGLFRQKPGLCQPQPGNDRPGAGQPGRRVFPGFPDQQQFFAHTGGRGQRFQNPTDRPGGRAGDCPAAGLCPQSAPKPALSPPWPRW